MVMTSSAVRRIRPLIRAASDDGLSDRAGIHLRHGAVLGGEGAVRLTAVRDGPAQGTSVGRYRQGKG